MRLRFILFLFLIGFYGGRVPLLAEVIYLENGDHITGEIIHSNAGNTIVKTEAMGVISINQGLIDRNLTDRAKAEGAELMRIKPEEEKPEEKKPKIWVVIYST